MSLESGVSEVWSLESGIRGLVSEIWSQECGHWKLRFGLESGTRILESRVRCLDSGV